MTTHSAFGLPIEALNVVVVEDSRAIQALIHSMLTAYRVARVRLFDGVEPALNAMKEERPNLVIADWQMAPYTGLHLLAAMRRKEAGPLATVPLIMMTGLATQQLVEQCLTGGAHGFLVKPLSPAVLHRTISHVLADSRPMRLVGDRYVVGDEARAVAAR